MGSVLGDFLNSINKKQGGNLIEQSDAPEITERDYPAFPVNRLLSYHPDAILLVNELNIRGASECRVTKRMQYEYLYYVLPKRSRFARMAKEKSDERLDLIMATYGYSRSKAELVSGLLSDEQIEELRRMRDTGGKSS